VAATLVPEAGQLSKRRHYATRNRRITLSAGRDPDASHWEANHSMRGPIRPTAGIGGPCEGAFVRGFGERMG